MLRRIATPQGGVMKTTLYTVLCVAIRLGAVLMAVDILEQVPGLFVFATQAQDGHLAWGVPVIEAIGLLLAFALWTWPNLLAWWALGRNRHEVLETSITADQLQYIVLSVVGAWMVVRGVSACLARIAYFLLQRHEAESSGAQFTNSTNEWHLIIQYALVMLAGAALMLGSRGLVGLLRRLRGYPDVITETDPDASTTQDG